MYRVLIAACLTLLVPWAGADVFSSTARLQTLFEAADQVEGLLDNYIQQEEVRLRAVKILMTEVKSMRNRTAGEDVTFVEHPLGAFHFIKKYARLHEHLDAGNKNKQNLLTELESRNLWIPTSVDLHGSASALLRLQRCYKIPRMELYNGSIRGRNIDPLTLQDANLIARTAYTQEYFSQAKEWYDVSFRREAADPDVTLEQRRLSALGLVDLYLQNNDFANAEKFAKWGKQVYPNDSKITSAYNKTMERLENYRSGDSTLPPPVVPTPIGEHYAALCRGEVDWNNEYLSHGYCTVTTDSVPYRLVKQEVLSLDPFVAVFYDVLSEAEAKFLQSQARDSDMYRATIGDPSNPEVSDVRVSQVTWVFDTDPEVSKISDRISRITGLDLTMREQFSSAEPFQVVNYGIGGHYDPHLDVYDTKSDFKSVETGFPDFLVGSGERIATFLFYLDDVVEGGATVFPRIGVRVPVVKYGAAFWYNLHRNGETDERTVHGGCPVLLGQKWVANKWIEEWGQEFRHRCGLTPETPHLQL